MVKNGGNKVTIVRTKQNSLSFPNGLAEPLVESFYNYKSSSNSKLLAGLLEEGEENTQHGWKAQC